jgi:hypothetical protein
MITNGNPEVIEFQQTLDELEVFSSNHDLPDLMRRRCVSALMYPLSVGCGASQHCESLDAATLWPPSDVARFSE